MSWQSATSAMEKSLSISEANALVKDKSERFGLSPGYQEREHAASIYKHFFLWNNVCEII